MSEYKWLIDIYSDSITNSLSKNWNCQCDKVMIGIHDGFHDSEIDYFFSSHLLNELDNEDKALNEAKRLVTLYNGILYLLNVTHFPIILTSRIMKNPYFDSTEELSNKQKEYYENSPVQRIWDLLEEDADIRKIVRLLGKKHKDTEFYELYKLYEILHNKWKTRDSNKAKKIHKNYDKFRRTANHPKSLGDDARHGHSNNEPLSKPMDIVEARKKVKFDCQELLEHLLNIRIDKENLPEYIERKFDAIDWSKLVKNKSFITSQELDKIFDEGEKDIIKYLDFSKAHRPGLEMKTLNETNLKNLYGLYSRKNRL